MVIWYIFTRFGMLTQEKSGNPADDDEEEVFMFDFFAPPTEKLKNRSDPAQLIICFRPK
jgi:hypothetical protein